MLPKIYRLSGPQLPRVLKSKKSYHSPIFILKVVKNNTETKINSKFAFIVSSQLSRQAVVRNRLKRLLRSAVSHHLDQVMSGYNVVVIGKKKLLTASFNDISSQLLLILKTAELLKDEKNSS